MNIDITKFTIIFILWNILTFAMMGIDKVKAKKGQWRISEATLLISAFLFGGIGSLCGSFIFRHKTQKWKFKMLLPIAVIVNILAIIVLCR